MGKGYPSHSKYAARKIPNARVTVPENGGHILIVHEKIRSEIVEIEELI
ncbi:MAG TPA: hypothetical protein VJJ51_10595 [Candidatus Methanoperedens sp.]|nr:hypothetical protein [Candidatus Methanoperedens sp.]HLB71478.1 hypothetical protein [Candidatus Methanoperedens sp.]